MYLIANAAAPLQRLATCCGLLLLLRGLLPASAAAAADPLVDTYKTTLPILLKGINVSNSYPRKAYASPYVLWGPRAFPVALGDDGEAPRPVVAAAQLASGSRVVAFGHEGIPASCCSTGDAWDRLVINSFSWLADAKLSNRSYIRLAAPRWTAGSDAAYRVKTALEAISRKPRFTVIVSIVDLDQFAADGAAAAANIDIMWIDSYTEYTPTQVTALLAFANQPGKGLVVAGHAWYWSYSHPNPNLFTDLAVNRILWPLGMLLTTDYQYGFEDAPRKPPADWPYYNAKYTLTALAAANSGGLPFNSTTFFPTANRALSDLVMALPSRSASKSSGLDGVWELLGAARSQSAGSLPVGPSSPLDFKTGYPGDVLDVTIETWTIRRGELTNLQASRSAVSFPGAPPANAPKVTVSLDINGTNISPAYRLAYGDVDAPAWRSTGLYAPPGQLITVTVKTASAVKKGLQVQIGAHTDDLSFKSTWLRVPYAVSRFALDSAVTPAGNPLGGLVYILVPRGSKLGKVQVTIKNAIRTPYFKLGSTSKASWSSTIRNYPGPWAEIDSGKFVIIVPSTAIRNLSDPTRLCEHWNSVLDGMAWLANMETYRARPERFLVDADISGGWMHAGHPIMAYNDPSVLQEVLDVSWLKANGAWGPYHELGHNHQWSEMMFSGTTESSTNLFTVYTLETTGVPPAAWENWSNAASDTRTAARTNYLDRGANWETEWDVWIALDAYLQLKEAFGWIFYRRVYAAYQTMVLPLPDDNVQTWIQTTSLVAGVNLVPFYTKWGFPISQRTRDAAAQLPAWSADPMNKE